MRKPSHLEEHLEAAQDPVLAARRAGLRYVSDQEPGITRRRSGRGFSYYHLNGRLIRDPRERERLRALAIPPAWTDVWICPYPNGHMQATGRDDQGRKQYLYHPDWRAVRDQAKYARMIPFGQALPGIRKQVAADLGKKGLPREKVLAAVVRLLEVSPVRVGNDEYARQNESYGLTTLRDRHVNFLGNSIRFEFRGKGGKRHQVKVSDRRLASVVKQCRDVPGYELFQYYDEEGNKQRIDSSDVNDYLREVSGEDFTAKDFRTWSGTLHAATELLECDPCTDGRGGKRAVNQAVKVVAERLGNTPAICRQCYIHPEVIERYLDGTLADSLLFRSAEGGARRVPGLEEREAAVLALLERSLSRDGRRG